MAQLCGYQHNTYFSLLLFRRQNRTKGSLTHTVLTPAERLKTTRRISLAHRCYAAGFRRDAIAPPANPPTTFRPCAILYSSGSGWPRARIR